MPVSKSSPEFQYVQGQSRPTFPVLFDRFEALNISALQSANPSLDLRYGPHDRQTFDLFTASSCAKGTLIYFHAGYWQSRDKAMFRFIAPAFTQLGLNVALVNYPLCPAVLMSELLEAARESVPVILDSVCESGGSAHPLFAAGHSAGGHIAVELALTDWTRHGFSSNPIAGVVALSGVYDLTPLVSTSLNDRLMLDASNSLAYSPLYRVVPGLPRALFVVGADETPAFIDQSQRMGHAWEGAGNQTEIFIANEADHFSLLMQFASRDSALFAKINQLF